MKLMGGDPKKDPFTFRYPSKVDTTNVDDRTRYVDEQLRQALADSERMRRGKSNPKLVADNERFADQLRQERVRIDKEVRRRAIERAKAKRGEQ